jgi:hypothetical protein
VHPRLSLVLASIVITAAPLLAAPTAPPTDFTLSAPSNIPGATLPPGPYTIRVLNRLSDRIILRVDAPGGTLHSTFIGISNSQIAKPSTAGPVRWSTPSNGATYLKGWYFPGTSSVVEFVYPKAEALSIASSNPSKVPAIDPASEGKVADSSLSQNDMQLLTLWLLSFHPVQSGDPAVSAERYQPVSASRQRPVIAALPHTAGNQPLIWLIALFSLLAATLLRIVRLRRRPSSLRDQATASGLRSSHVEPRLL